MSGHSDDAKLRPTVLFVVASLERGGTELNTLRSARVLSNRGYRVEVFNIGGPGAIETDLARYATIRHYPIRGFLSRTHLEVRSVFRRIVGELDQPIVHAQDAYSAAFVMFLGSLPVRLIAVNRRWETTGRRWLDWLNRVAYVRAKSVAVNARYLEERVRAEVRPFTPRIVLTPNFIETMPVRRVRPSEAALRSHLGIPAGAVVLSCVARLAPFKRIDLLITAVGALLQDGADVHVVIAGSGTSETYLKDLARQYGKDAHFHFLGHIQNSRDVYEATDIAVLCSDREGMPNSLVEAAAVGCALVASNVGGNPDIVVNGATGLLFERGSGNQLQQKLFQLIGAPDLRQAMGEAASERVKRDYSEQRYWEALTELYRLERASSHLLWQARDR